MDFYNIIDLCEYKIVGGTPYNWKCFPNARYVDLKSDFGSVSIIFDTLFQTVYEVTTEAKSKAWKDEPPPYRWINPEFSKAYLAEALERKINPYQAWDDVNYVEVETELDMLAKIEAVFKGNESFDRRVEVPITLSESEIAKLSLMAHERGITLNELVTEIVEAHVQQLEKEEITTVTIRRPEEYWSEVQWKKFETALYNDLCTSSVSVVYGKNNKELYCTLNPDLIPNATITEKTRPPQGEFFVVYDLDSNGWRSFNPKAVKSSEAWTHS